MKKTTDNRNFKTRPQKTSLKSPRMQAQKPEKTTTARPCPQHARTDKSRTNQRPEFSIINSLFQQSPLDADSKKVIDNFDEIIQGVRPLNSRQLQQLPENIRNLSHQLTDQRADRRLGYMNDNIQLSAYIRYYTWWNLVRLTRLFSNMPASAFPSADSVCLDLGSGPLTVVTALWLARPELRKLNLTWYCLDVSANSLSLGEDVFLSVSSRFSENQNWKIIRVKGNFGTSIRQKADFITCANMFNELDQNMDMPPEFKTKKYYDQLKNYSAQSCRFILIEPGVPKASRTVSLLRERFIKDKFKILAPCPHAQDCPMNGFKAYTGSQNKWCNFAFSTENSPSKLQKLSERAKLPKERATLCFTAFSNFEKSDSASKGEKPELLCRVTSDEFTLPPNAFGHYACSPAGLVLLKTFKPEAFKSGDLVSVKTKTPESPSSKTDRKSGALIIEL